MDDKKKIEMDRKQVEEALARKLGEALNRLSPRDSAGCPDATVLAAYQERSLQPDEIARCENHFAECSRCRKILNVLAAAGDAPLAEKVVAEIGKAAAAKIPTSGESGIGKKSSPRVIGWPIRWLAPALGVAVVLALWFVVRPPWRTTGPNPSETLVAQAPTNEVQPEPILHDQAPLPKVEPKQKPESENAAKAKSAVGSEKKSLTESNRAAKEVPVPASPPPPPPQNVQLQEALNGRAAAPMVADNISNLPAPDKQVVGEASREIAQPAVRIAGEMAKSARRDQGVSLALEATKESEISIPSRSGKVMWRVGKAGRIERSTDSGRTLALQTSPSQQDWLAGSAPSDTVCWLVGRSGSIARTLDGEHWITLTSPPLAAGASGQSPDWIGVTAINAQIATITSSSQQRYMTQDGGQTWQLQ